MSKQLEASFQRRVLKDLKTLPDTWVYKAADRVKRGIPDVLLCVRGAFIAIELKRDGEEPTPLQQFNLDAIRAAGGTSFYATPCTWRAHFDILRIVSHAK